MERAISFDRRHEIIRDRRISAVLGVAFFALCTALGAYVRIPLQGNPVPITLQTFFVMLSGAVLGKRLGTVSQSVYCALGIAGLPVFQGCSFGIAHLFGPTGGYLVGFLAASAVIGALTETTDPKRGRLLLAFVAGDLIIHFCGALWLMGAYGVRVPHALSAGILVFIPGEALKIALASEICLRVSKRARQIFIS